MGSYYRERHQQPASTTSQDLAGLGASSAPNLDDMTKDQLLQHAQAIGVTPANASMTKAELRAAIDAA